MTNPRYLRLRIIGTLYGDAAWSIGMNWTPGDAAHASGTFDATIQQALETWVDNVKGLNSGNVFSGSLDQILSNSGLITQIRASAVEENGKETAVAEVTLGSPVGGSNNPNQPAQSALVASLVTAKPGASYRGRVYLPCLAVPLVGGRVSAAQTANVASDYVSLVGAVKGAAGQLGGAGAPTYVVVSARQNVLTPVTSVRVGNRLDTQRRRAESEKEVYSVAAVAQ